MKVKKILLAIALCLPMIGCTDPEKEAAINQYNQTIDIVEANNAQIQTKIDNLRNLCNSDDKPLDETLITEADNIIVQAKDYIVDIQEIPAKTEEIIQAAEELNEQTDIDEIVNALDESYEKLSDSIAQKMQVTNPSESFILERLSDIPNIVEIQFVTEDNDPNGHLHKNGGYTSACFFSSDLIDQSEVYGEGVIGKGTEGGGSVEVYETEAYAAARDEYLGSLDGLGFLSPGSHTVVGTVVIRTSEKLTASQQNEMTENIYNSLIELRE